MQVEQKQVRFLAAASDWSLLSSFPHYTSLRERRGTSLYLPFVSLSVPLFFFVYCSWAITSDQTSTDDQQMTKPPGDHRTKQYDDDADLMNCNVNKYTSVFGIAAKALDEELSALREFKEWAMQRIRASDAHMVQLERRVLHLERKDEKQEQPYEARPKSEKEEEVGWGIEMGDREERISKLKRPSRKSKRRASTGSSSVCENGNNSDELKKENILIRVDEDNDDVVKNEKFEDIQPGCSDIDKRKTAKRRRRSDDDTLGCFRSSFEDDEDNEDDDDNEDGEISDIDVETDNAKRLGNDSQRNKAKITPPPTSLRRLATTPVTSNRPVSTTTSGTTKSTTFDGMRTAGDAARIVRQLARDTDMRLKSHVKTEGSKRGLSKDERAAGFQNAHACAECEEFFRGDERLLRKCGRHRTVHKKRETPNEYWALSFDESATQAPSASQLVDVKTQMP